MAYSEIISANPKFSVIMPLYNKEAYVEKAIRSVLSQSFKDWELIVVNDGSSDKSLDVAGRTIDGDIRCKVINQSNSGVGAARNYGVSKSVGDYLCFLDADDWWEPTFLEEMSRFVEDYPDAGLYAANYIYYKPGKTHIALDHPIGYMNYPKTYYTTGAMPIITGAVCMSRESFERHGGFPVNIKLGEDFLLWSKIALENKVAFLNKPLAYYNNEIPASQRATRHIYAPESHMLYNMDWLDMRLADMEDNTDWKCLLDMLRVNGLLDYWLNKKYHQKAAVELNKVDWSNQPKSIIRKYKMPIWVMIFKTHFMKIGSKIKQLFV